MKRIISLLIIYLIANSCITSFAQITGKHQNDLSLQKLRGRVKSITEHDTAFDDFYKPPIVYYNKSKLKFNEQGYKTDEYIYKRGSEDEIIFHISYKYNAKGFQQTSTDQNGNIHILSKQTTNSYDSKHNMVESIQYDQASYNPKHELIKTPQSDSHISIIVHNKKDHIDTLTFKSSKPSSKVINHYNTLNDNIAAESYLPDEKIASKTTWVYDNDHNKIQQLSIVGNNEARYKKNSKYDKYGNEIMHIDSNADYMGGVAGGPPFNKGSGKIITHFFKYSDLDKKDNWLQSTTIVNGKIIRITKREIEYY